MGESYLAPGVYVEEVPSPVQPIAGVGTNTAAFIGIVPDEVRYPVLNPTYDPTLAAAAASPAIDTEKINSTQADLTRLRGDLAQAQQRLDAIPQQLAQSDLEERQRTTLTREQTDLPRRIERLRG